jgi:hypothetical protein
MTTTDANFCSVCAIPSRSSGFSVCTEVTATRAPVCCSSTSATSKAILVIGPYVRMQTSLPSRMRRIFPKTNGSGAFDVRSGSPAFPRRRYTGPLRSTAAQVAAAVSAGSHGAITVMFGSADMIATSSCA